MCAGDVGCSAALQPRVARRWLLWPSASRKCGVELRPYEYGELLAGCGERRYLMYCVVNSGDVPAAAFSFDGPARIREGAGVRSASMVICDERRKRPPRLGRQLPWPRPAHTFFSAVDVIRLENAVA